MNYTEEQAVREIAIENPASARLFESLGIDYCCGGQRTLRDACTRAGVSVEGVLDQLTRSNQAETPDTNRWNSASLASLIAQIVQKHHAFVRRETPRLEGLLTKVVDKHGQGRPELRQIQDVFSSIGQELTPHMFKEEQILFPYIEEMEAAFHESQPVPPAFFGTVKGPIANMVADHEDAGGLLSRMRELSGGYVPPESACPTYHALYRGLEEFERDLHQHIHLENNILFPRALELEHSHSEASNAAR